MNLTPQTSIHVGTDLTLPEHERTMLAYGVSHDGHRYLYNGYRYDRWEDAVDQAELMALAAAGEEPGRTVYAANPERRHDERRRPR